MGILKFSSLLLVLLISISSYSMSKVLKKVDYTVPVITNEKYDEILKTGKPLFLSFNAKWCPSCQRQNKALGSVMSEFNSEAFIYTVDWDKKDEFKGPKSSERTTIAFIKDNKIVARIVGEMDSQKIASFIRSKIDMAK